MTIHNFSLTKDLTEMNEGELRSTLKAFMEQHTENVEAYEALEGERDEFSERVDALEGEVETAQTYFAERASEYTHLDTEVIVERFSLDETIEMAGEADSAAAAQAEAEYTEETEEADSEDAADSESVFADKPDKAPVVETEETETGFASEAESDLSRILGLQ